MTKKPNKNKDPQKGRSKNSDHGFTQDYTEELIRKKEPVLRNLLNGAKVSDVDRFIERIRYPVSAYYAHLRVHDSIPVAKDQKRYLTKLRGKAQRLLNHAADMSELLDEAPFELRRAATKAQAPLHEIKASIDALMLAMNEIVPSKTKYKPEIRIVVRDVTTAFCEVFHLNPVVRSFSEASEIPDELPIEERFVPLLAELLNIDVNSAYWNAKKSNLPS